MPKLSADLKREYAARLEAAVDILSGLRRNFGMRDEVIAAKLGVSLNSVFRWRHGTMSPRERHLSALRKLWEKKTAPARVGA